MFQKGFAEVIPSNEQEPPDGQMWYIPHHGVYHPQKRKLRVVFNCAAVYDGTSLNQELLSGPDLTNSLLGVFLRFRQEQYVAVGDIESMFYQVRVPAAHQNFQRFLWWKDGDLSQYPVKCRMKVHMFGTTSSPSCANAALLKTVDDNASDFTSDAAEVVRKHFYVDDCLISARDADTTVNLVTQVKGLRQKGGFKIVKWMSNSTDILEKMPKEDRAEKVKDVQFPKDPLPNESVLGVYWHVRSDTFSFKLSKREVKATRRSLLSLASSLYDPLGFICPFVLTAKILLQDLCRQGIGWNEELSGRDLNIWTQWMKDLSRLSEVEIPRCYKTVEMDTIHNCQLHVFCDASAQGYGGVAYLRLTSETGKVHCSQCMAKSRVTPLKKVTMPRLELTAVCVAVRLSSVIQKELQYDIDDVYYWTDSMAVIRYLANETSRFKTFVANRITTIRDASEPHQWKYVPSELNPSDAASRGVQMSTLLSMTRWFRGPEFLWEDKDKWPKACPPPEDENDPEKKKAVNVTLINDSHDAMDKLFKYSSSWMKLKRTVAWYLVFMRVLKQKVEAKKDNCRKVPKKSPETHVFALTVDMMEKAEKSIILYVQKQYFPDILRYLQGSTHHACSKQILKLDPVLVDDVIRVGVVWIVHTCPLKPNIRFYSRRILAYPDCLFTTRMKLSDTWAELQ